MGGGGGGGVNRCGYSCCSQVFCIHIYIYIYICIYVYMVVSALRLFRVFGLAW